MKYTAYLSHFERGVLSYSILSLLLTQIQSIVCAWQSARFIKKWHETFQHYYLLLTAPSRRWLQSNKALYRCVGWFYCCISSIVLIIVGTAFAASAISRNISHLYSICPWLSSRWTKEMMGYALMRTT